MKYGLGCILPEEKKYVEKYPFSRLGLEFGLQREWALPYPYILREYYDQRETNACVGYACSWMTSINNIPKPFREENPQAFKYDAEWLYTEARYADEDINNNPPNDFGAYIYAAMHVLRTMGHVKITTTGSQKSNINAGIQNYYWLSFVPEMKTALALSRAIVFGINWYEEFMTPIYKYGRWWIGESNNWGKALGGHAICGFAYSDMLEGFKLTNSWGRLYPATWISYKSIERLMQECGEACVAVDNPKIA